MDCVAYEWLPIDFRLTAKHYSLIKHLDEALDIWTLCVYFLAEQRSIFASNLRSLTHSHLNHFARYHLLQSAMVVVAAAMKCFACGQFENQNRNWNRIWIGIESELKWKLNCKSNVKLNRVSNRQLNENSVWMDCLKMSKFWLGVTDVLLKRCKIMIKPVSWCRRRRCWWRWRWFVVLMHFTIEFDFTKGVCEWD